MLQFITLQRDRQIYPCAYPTKERESSIKSALNTKENKSSGFSHAARFAQNCFANSFVSFFVNSLESKTHRRSAK
ncbi:MAG: hypothetical protein EAZ92_04055 [Candidatus Kapaibacterium sp.]|nr:MAG: hypothetical protein EAZ92_04055 [Candidatus Kapabacteria bacterium]